MATTSTPYTTARQFIATLPSWLGQADAERIAAYQLYEDMYWNMPDTFKLMQRGSDTAPIYIPSARVIIEATNRYLAKDWDYVIDPRIGTPADRELIDAQLKRLFKRELMWAKFSTQKRFGLIRGDAVWHIVADPTKAPGKRLSVYEVDPAAYFPIYQDDDLDRLVGCHLVDQIEYASKTVIRRQTYRKDPVSGVITSELALFESAKWDDRDLTPYTDGTSKANTLKLIAQLQPVTPLPPQITALPVYHIKNNRTPGSPFGSSELRGLERISAAVNQAISDQELSLALDGIGLYATTSGPPVDADGNETNWTLGPGRVVELDATADFKRISGVQSLPGLEHIKFLLSEQRRGAGVPDIAAGMVDVTVAESGIALALQLSPLLAKNAEKEQEMLGVYDHMLYDITHAWLPTFEGFTIADVEVTSIVSDPMPINRKDRIDEILKLVAGGLVSAAYAREKLIELGYEFPENMGADIVQEITAISEARSFDPFASRVASELLDGTQA